MIVVNNGIFGMTGGQGVLTAGKILIRIAAAGVAVSFLYRVMAAKTLVQEKKYIQNQTQG